MGDGWNGAVAALCGARMGYFGPPRCLRRDKVPGAYSRLRLGRVSLLVHPRLHWQGRRSIPNHWHHPGSVPIAAVRPSRGMS